jgi:GNAT superfamily N-acetyltransferase
MTARPVTDFDIVPLTPDRLADLRTLFDEGGDPRTCQCAFWRVPASGWSDWTRDRNRTVLESLAGDDPAPGLVAYAEGRAVGWVSIGPREDYVRLERSKSLARIDDRPVWSIVCFVVSKPFRGRGIAAALLAAAVDLARSHGAELVEAYPVDADRGRVSPAAAYMGPLEMFGDAGFEVVARLQWRPSAPVRPIVRREI